MCYRGSCGVVPPAEFVPVGVLTISARKRFNTNKSLNSNDLSGKHGGFPDKSDNSWHCQCSDKGLIPICRKCT